MPTPAPSTATIRSWAQGEGLDVAERGRLKPEILSAYAKASGPAAKPKAVPAKRAATTKSTTTKAPARRSAAKTAPKPVAMSVPGPTKVAEVSSRLELYMTPHAQLITRMCEVPGIDKLTAWTVLAEIGTDLSAFADAPHLASWAALCPGNNESAGKRKQGRTRKGNRYLRRALVQAAWAAGHSKGTFLSALFFRLARRLAADWRRAARGWTCL